MKQRHLTLEDWFVPVSAAQRAAGLEAYEAHLAARDGRPDVATRHLPCREARMAQFRHDDGRFQGRIDAAQFAAYLHATPGPGTPDAPPVPLDLLFVFACVRANTYEEYAVEQLIETIELHQEAMPNLVNLTIMFEEYYHTKFLCSIAALFGLNLGVAPTPPFVVRALIAGLRHLPLWVAHPLTLCAEIIGLALFLQLYELAGAVFADDPALRHAIELRLGEVIADELGHISYNRLLITPVGLQIARRLLPLVARGSRHGLPGTEALGLYPFSFAAMYDWHVGCLPDGILDQAFLA